MSLFGRTRRLTVLLVALSACLGLLAAGCRQHHSEVEAVRAAIRQHLTSLGTLNLQGMDMEFTRVAVQDGHADADVTFRPKNGASGGAAMQVAYQLEKRDGAWTVMKSAVGGMIQHPPAGANPHQQPAQGPVHGDLPNFKDIIGGSAASPPPQKLPPGHPPVN